MYRFIRRYIAKIILIITAALAIFLAGMRVAGFVPYIVTSGSMSPAFDAGSMIYVKATVPEAIQVGDPITYLAGNAGVVTHRVIDIDMANQLYYTKGDANESADSEPVSFYNLIGKPVLYIPLLGYFSYYVTTPPGLYIAIGAAALILVFMFFPPIHTKASEGKNEDHAF